MFTKIKRWLLNRELNKLKEKETLLYVEIHVKRRGDVNWDLKMDLHTVHAQIYAIEDKIKLFGEAANGFSFANRG